MITQEPHQVGALHEVSLTGTWFPIDVLGQPVLLTFPGSDALYLPCFRSLAQLHEAMAGMAYAAIQEVVDEGQFFSSLRAYPSIRVVLDLRKTAENRFRYLLVQDPRTPTT